MILAVLLLAVSILAAPRAYADWDHWDAAVAPVRGDAAISPSYLTPAPGTYPVGPPGTIQVFETPPGSWKTPGPLDWCGETTSPAEIPALCHAGWNYYVR